MKYRIILKECANHLEDYWRWEVSQDGKMLAEGQAEYRIGARWAAQKAARRHARGLPPIKPSKVPQNDYIYEV